MYRTGGSYIHVFVNKNKLKAIVILEKIVTIKLSIYFRRPIGRFRLRVVHRSIS
jgi:hypothetical protein